MTDLAESEGMDPTHAHVLPIAPARQPSSMLAFAVVEFGFWIVCGVRLMLRDDGTFWVAMPGVQDQEGRWRDTCFVPARAARDRLCSAVVDAFRTTSQTGGGAAGREGASCR